MKHCIVLAITLSLVACKDKPAYDQPPPVSNGKCLADFYVGKRAQNQTCTYIGYVWKCADNGADASCQRGAEVGGELPHANPATK